MTRAASCRHPKCHEHTRYIPRIVTRCLGTTHHMSRPASCHTPCRYDMSRDIIMCATRCLVATSCVPRGASCMTHMSQYVSRHIPLCHKASCVVTVTTCIFMRVMYDCYTSLCMTFMSIFRFYIGISSRFSLTCHLVFAICVTYSHEGI